MNARILKHTQDGTTVTLGDSLAWKETRKPRENTHGVGQCKCKIITVHSVSVGSLADNKSNKIQDLFCTEPPNGHVGDLFGL